VNPSPRLRALLLGASLTALSVAAPAHADTLREALVSAYSTNPTIEQARADQRVVDEGVPIARSQALPSATLTATHIEFVRRSANSFTAPARNLDVTTQVLVPIYSGGAVKNNILAAEQRVEAGRAQLRNAESILFTQVVVAYMDVLRTEALTALAANQVEVLGVNVEATSDRFEIGDLTRTDVAQSQSRFAQAEGELRTAEANLIGARETYIQLVGSAPGELEAPPPLQGMPGSVNEAVSVALENNPGLIATKQAAEAAGYDTKVAGAGRKPTVGVFVSGNYSDFYGTLGGPISQDFSQAETTANAGVRVTFPLFQGGLPAARERQASARETSALEQVIETERETIRAVRATYANWQGATAAIESAKKAVEAGEISLEGVRAENSIGNRTILDVLNAEQELLIARVQLVTARRNAYVAGFNLLALMGRAEARDLNLDIGGPLYDPTVYYDGVRDKFWDWDRADKAEPNSTRTVDIPAANATFGPTLEPGD
jgi:outer membrane protein